MIDFSIFREITLLYVEDEEKLRVNVGLALDKLFKKVYIAENGIDALEIYQNCIINRNPVDVLITDITMPKLNGIELVEKVKQINPKQEVIMLTAHTDSSILLEAIKLNIRCYELKPLNINSLLEKLSVIVKNYLNQKAIEKKNLEAKSYLEILEQIAIVSKTDLKGNITYANDMFCKISGYTKDELIHHNHRIIKHPDTPREVFEQIWKTISNDQIWHGKLKNMGKNEHEYFVYGYILPIFNDATLEKIGYLSARFPIDNFEF